MASTLPAALAAAVDVGEVTTWQALALDHLIDDDRDRLGYQLDIADRMRAGGIAGRPRRVSRSAAPRSGSVSMSLPATSRSWPGPCWTQRASTALTGRSAGSSTPCAH